MLANFLTEICILDSLIQIIYCWLSALTITAIFTFLYAGFNWFQKINGVAKK